MKVESKELPVEIMELQMGPSHPATHGTIKLNLRFRIPTGSITLRR